jgi:hypothetical protein
MLDECKNVFIEHLGPTMYQVCNSAQPADASADAVYCQVISFWISVLNDSKNMDSIAAIYIDALNTVKAMLLSSGKLNRSI